MYSTNGQTDERTTKKVVLRLPCQHKISPYQCLQTGHMKENRVSKENNMNIIGDPLPHNMFNTIDLQILNQRHIFLRTNLRYHYIDRIDSYIRSISFNYIQGWPPSHTHLILSKALALIFFCQTTIFLHQTLFGSKLKTLIKGVFNKYVAGFYICMCIIVSEFQSQKKQGLGFKLFVIVHFSI